MIDRTRFFVNPQHDSEGFTMPEAKCVGCGPEDMCPRSGHCENYDSPLRDLRWSVSHTERWTHHENVREDQRINAVLANAHVDGMDFTPVPAEVQKVVAAHFLNPKGWQEVDGVELPPVHPWAELTDSPRHLQKLALVSDETLEAAFQAWLRTSTRPENKEAYRERLRVRIEEMVRRAQP